MRLRFFVKVLFVLIALISMHTAAKCATDSEVLDLFNQKRYSEIISNFDEYRKNDTTHTPTKFITLAACYFALNKTKKAEEMMSILDSAFQTTPGISSINYNYYAWLLENVNPRESIKWYLKAGESDTTQETDNICSIIDVYKNKLHMYDSALYYVKQIERKSGIKLSEFKFEDDGWTFVTTSGVDFIYLNQKATKSESGTYLCWDMYDWDGKRLGIPPTYYLDVVVQRFPSREVSIFYSREDSIQEAIDFRHKVDSIKFSRKGVYCTRNLWEYNLGKNMVRLISFTDYGRDGKVIESDEVDNSHKQNEGWYHVVPGSIGEIKLEALKKEIQRKEHKEMKPTKTKRTSRSSEGI